LPVPTEPKVTSQGAPSVPTHGSQLLIARPEGYFSRERDPVLIDNKIATDEPAGFPLNDAFLATLPTSSTQVTSVTLRNEIIAARSSTDLVKDLPVVDLLW
jgi:triacylglycerol lipase